MRYFNKIIKKHFTLKNSTEITGGKNSKDHSQKLSYHMTN